MPNPPVEPLQPALAELLALERAILLRVAELRARTGDRAQAGTLLSEIEQLAQAHAANLRTRLEGTPVDLDQPAAALLSLTPAPAHHSASSALRDAYTIVQQAVIGYSALQPIANRMRDSWVTGAEEGTTAHIARDHLQQYTAAAGRLVTALHDLVVDELDTVGEDCRCTCPSCGIGVCICAISARGVIAQAAVAARPPLAEHGIELRPPRPGSAAAAAGLQPGDLITAVDGTVVEATSALLGLVRDHQPGDIMQFTVRRAGDEVTIPVEHRREGVDGRERSRR